MRSGRCDRHRRPAAGPRPRSVPPGGRHRGGMGGGAPCPSHGTALGSRGGRRGDRGSARLRGLGARGLRRLADGPRGGRPRSGSACPSGGAFGPRVGRSAGAAACWCVSRFPAAPTRPRSCGSWSGSGPVPEPVPIPVLSRAGRPAGGGRPNPARAASYPRSSTWTAPVPAGIVRGGAEREDVVAPSKPPVHHRFQNRPSPVRASPLAVDDGHATKTAGPRAVDELQHRPLRFGCEESVQVEPILDRMVTAPQPADLPGAGGRGGRIRCGCRARCDGPDRARIRLPAFPRPSGAGMAEARRAGRRGGWTRSPSPWSGRVPPTCRRKSEMSSSSCEEPFMSGPCAGGWGKRSLFSIRVAVVANARAMNPEGRLVEGDGCLVRNVQPIMPGYLHRFPGFRPPRFGTRRPRPGPGAL